MFDQTKKPPEEDLIDLRSANVTPDMDNTPDKKNELEQIKKEELDELEKDIDYLNPMFKSTF